MKDIEILFILGLILQFNNWDGTKKEYLCLKYAKTHLATCVTSSSALQCKGKIFIP